MASALARFNVQRVPHSGNQMAVQLVHLGIGQRAIRGAIADGVREALLPRRDRWSDVLVEQEHVLDQLFPPGSCLDEANHLVGCEAFLTHNR